MIFDADGVSNSKAEKEDESDLEACSSGISMRSSQIEMEREMGNLQVEAGASQPKSPDVDASELHDYQTLVSKMKQSSVEKPSRKEAVQKTMTPMSKSKKVIEFHEEDQPRRKSRAIRGSSRNQNKGNAFSPSRN